MEIDYDAFGCYMVRFSRIVNGKRVTESDVTHEFGAKYAVKEITRRYGDSDGDLDGFRIEEVLADCGNGWRIVESWEWEW